MNIRCHHCGYEWNYTGKHPYWATCPKCMLKVRVSYPRLKNLPKLKKEEVIYTAGFFDGEGSISIAKKEKNKKPSYWLELKLTNACEEIIRHTHSLFKVGRVERKNDNRGNKTQWVWRVNSNEAKEVLKQLLPF